MAAGELAVAVTSAVFTPPPSLVVVVSEDEVDVMLRLTVRLPEVVAYKLAFILWFGVLVVGDICRYCCEKVRKGLNFVFLLLTLKSR